MRRLLTLTAGAVLLVAACGGETFVEYRGSVVAADQAGHSFDDEPNPAGLPPVTDAEVTFTVCFEGCDGARPDRRVRVDGAGEWGPIVETFGGGFGDHEILIEVAAPGFAPYRYSTIYETTPDPTAGERYLNIALARQ